MRPVFAYTSQLQSKWVISYERPNFFPAASRTRNPSGTTSRPMPSPSITAILNVDIPTILFQDFAPMTQRFIAFVVAACLAAPIALAAQAPANMPPYTPPKLANGQPDIQGIWQVLDTAAWDLQDHG